LLDTRPEWKQFDEGGGAGARCSQGVNPLLPQASLGTSVGGYAGSRTKRLHVWAKMPYKERSLNNEFKEFKEICYNAELLKCIEDDAKIMYKMASECTHLSGKNMGSRVITRGVNRRSIKAACLFYACIRKGETRTSKEIAEMWGIEENEMNKGRRNLQKLFKIKDKARKSMLNADSSKPEHFIKRYCESLKIQNKYVQDAINIAINIEKLNLASGHTPCSSAAASILLMAEINNLDHITKKRISGEFGVSDSTISKTYKEIEPHKNTITNNNSTNKAVKKIDDALSKQEIPQEVLDRMKQFGVTTENKPTPEISNSSNLSGFPSTDSLNTVEDNISEFDINEFDEIICSELDNDELDNDDELQYKLTSMEELLRNKPIQDIETELDILTSASDLIQEVKSKLNNNNFFI